MRKDLAILALLIYWFGSGVFVFAFFYLGVKLVYSATITGIFYIIASILVTIAIRKDEVVLKTRKLCPICGNEVSETLSFCDVCLTSLKE